MRAVAAIGGAVLIAATALVADEPVRAAYVPICAPFPTELGSPRIDYDVAPDAGPAITAARAEELARAMVPPEAVVCSVRLAKYDNLAEHHPLVWAVHFDGFTVVPLGLLSPKPLRARSLVILSATDGAGITAITIGGP